MMIWNVYIIKGLKWVKIGEHKFDYYDKKRCMRDIIENRLDLAKQIFKPFRKNCDWLGQSWDIAIKEWN